MKEKHMIFNSKFLASLSFSLGSVNVCNMCNAVSYETVDGRWVCNV